MKITGKVSSFGGPNDTGVTASEDLAFWEEYSQVPDPERLFLPAQPPGTTGLARRLDPEKYYVACRWPYEKYSKSELASGDHVAMVRSPKTGHQTIAWPADWGPNENTGRAADISPGLMSALGIVTDDLVEVTYPFGEEEEQEERPVQYGRIAISAGHGKRIAGASGYIEENIETPKVTKRVADELRLRGATVFQFWDQTSTSVNANLDAIIDWHNSLERDLDVSIHFNCSEENPTPKPIGTECWYVTQQELANRVATAIAETGFKNRGSKYSSSLAFLNQTDKPAILIEVCFVNSKPDTDLYKAAFPEICFQIAEGILGQELPVKPPIDPIQPPVEPPITASPGPIVVLQLTVPDGVGIAVTINGEPMFLSDEEP